MPGRSRATAETAPPPTVSDTGGRLGGPTRLMPRAALPSVCASSRERVTRISLPRGRHSDAARRLASAPRSRVPHAGAPAAGTGPPSYALAPRGAVPVPAVPAPGQGISPGAPPRRKTQEGLDIASSVGFIRSCCLRNRGTTATSVGSSRQTDAAMTPSCATRRGEGFFCPWCFSGGAG
jgi:hypothetical protein